MAANNYILFLFYHLQDEDNVSQAASSGVVPFKVEESVTKMREEEDAGIKEKVAEALARIETILDAKTEESANEAEKHDDEDYFATVSDHQAPDKEPVEDEQKDSKPPPTGESKDTFFDKTVIDEDALSHQGYTKDLVNTLMHKVKSEIEHDKDIKEMEEFYMKEGKTGSEGSNKNSGSRSSGSHWRVKSSSSSTSSSSTASETSPGTANTGSEVVQSEQFTINPSEKKSGTEQNISNIETEESISIIEELPEAAEEEPKSPPKESNMWEKREGASSGDLADKILKGLF